MPTNIQAHDLDLPSIDDTIAAVSILGQILDELRSRLAASERTVASLEQEKLALRSELRAIVDAVSRPVAPPIARSAMSPTMNAEGRRTRDITTLEGELMAIMKGIDASFTRRAA